MRLYILRHADADTEAPTDAERFLSKKGKQQSERVARFCGEHELKPDVILTSPLRRAHETAKAVADALGVELITVDWLACGAKPATILAKLEQHRKPASLMLVGHEPDLSGLVAHLLGVVNSHAIVVRKASLTAVELLACRAGGGQLDFSIPAKLM